MANIEGLKQYKNIHMIGIGGISMSGIAEILKFWGFHVTGSDSTASEVTEKLIKSGIPVTIGHDLVNLIRADIVVYSAAIKPDDLELVKARELNIPTIDRGTFLGKITKAFHKSICISGTHGKTTTTSMISMCFLEAGKDPSIQVGAYLKPINGNYRVGASEYFIIEACEYTDSYLKLFPNTEIILNIDNDHLDYFGTFDNIVASFQKYVKLLPENGLLVFNFDDKNCRKIAKEAICKTVSYSIENANANFVARNINFDKNGFAHFDVYYNNYFYKTIALSVPGMHNVLNALACIATCHEYGLEKEEIKKALSNFTGSHRRFEYIGSFNQGVSVFDDYGHHPTEILATSQALSKKQCRQSWVVFQPHTYSRTKFLLHDFAKALLDFDHVIVTDIYAAREDNTYNISSMDLVNVLNDVYHKQAIYISDFSEIVKYLKEHTIKGDIVLTLGAGTITNIGSMLCDN